MFNTQEILKYELRRYGITFCWTLPAAVLVGLLSMFDIGELTLMIVGIGIGVPMGLFGQFRWTKKHPEPPLFK